MKKIVRNVLIVTLLCVMSVNCMHTQKAFAGELRQPDTLIVNGDVVYENLGEQGIYESVRTGRVQSRMLLGYEYVPEKERLLNKRIIREMAYIYGTSVKYCEGASPNYTLNVTKSKTKTTEWNVSGKISGEFDISVVKTKLEASGGYKSSETATITLGETWNCGFTIPGTYDLTWYMRGHQYDCQCGVKYISTDSNDGRFTHYNLGTAIFPTDEITFEVTRVN